MSRMTVLPPDRLASAHGVKAAGWWHESDDHLRVVCDLCPRGCAVAEGNRGFCFVRQNLGGEMVSTTYGRSTGFCIDPIEKKPLNHFYPGSAVLSFGTAGCNLGCKFCQNWESSKSRETDAAGQRADPETVARAAQSLGCRSAAFTYNDPVVWAEYAIDCAKACRAAGVKTVAVTAGYITPLARTNFYEVMDAANVDLKGFSEDFYREVTNGHLAPVQDTLQWLARETNVWLEVTTLLIPGKNDAEEELKRMCAWYVEALGADVPLHFTAFHPDFRMTEIPPTPPAVLAKAHAIAVAAGLKYVYTGNVSDQARQSTYCPGCGHTLIGRDGYRLSAYNLEQDRCRRCGTQIAGRFDPVPGDWGPRRQPVRIAEFARAHAVRAAAINLECGNLLPLSKSGQGPQGQSGDDHASMVPAPHSKVVVSEKPAFTPDQERLIFEAAGRRFIAKVQGQRPASLAQSLGDLAAKTVAGAFVTVRRSGELRSCCGALGEAMPLAMAIERAAVSAAKHDHRFPPISPHELPGLDIHVTLLSEMVPVVAKGADRRKAVVIGKHGLRISRGNRQGLLLPVVAVEHGLDAEEFLVQVCRKAGLPANAWLADDADLMTFQGHAIEGDLRTLLETSPGKEQPPTSDRTGAETCVADHGYMVPGSAKERNFRGAKGDNPTVVDSPVHSSAPRNVPAPNSGGEVRFPAVAGAFYPGRPEEIKPLLDEWFAEKQEPGPWAAALVPHAGWVYSGRLAAEVFSRVKFPRQVIIVAPRHRPEGADWAVAPHRFWQLPGCRLESDRELAEKLAASITGLRLDAAAHAHEHAIEVQLPLVARLAPQSRVVGIVIGPGQFEDMQRFGEQLADVLAGLDERPLLVISSDMNHFADERETCRLDRMALDALAAFDPERLYRTVRDNRISMCGVLPAVAVLSTLGRLNSLNRCYEVGHSTSAAASGDTQRCVGYAGMLFA